MASRDRHIGRNVALVGGAAIVAWLLWRGNRVGTGRPSGSGSDATPSTMPKVPCRVWVRADRLELDGVSADLATVVGRCREAGRAGVRATGDAITRSIIDVLRALKTAGVVVDAPPDLAYLVAHTPETPR